MAPRLIETPVAGAGVFAVRTPTLPPATHTNVWVLGGDGPLTVVDPASPWEDEQGALLRAIDAHGGGVERIVLTHHHHDHVGGAVALQRALAGRGIEVPILAHPETARWLEGMVAVDGVLEDGDTVHTSDGRRWDVVFTPGHAPGHVVLHAADTGTVVAGDLVAGVGTILIDPGDGDLGEYLASLQRMLDRSPGALLPSHGPVLQAGEAVLGFYIAHRHDRSAQIARALTAAPSHPEDLVAAIYPDLPALAAPIAARQIESHLRWLVGEGQAVRLEDGRYGSA